MQTVYLNGSISKFGDVWHTDCANIRDIFKLIECQTSGFRQHLVDAADANIGYEIQRGSDFLESENELLLSLKDEDIIITEVPSGSKSGGAKILAAIAIVAVVAFTGGFGAVGGGTAQGFFANAAGTGLNLAGQVAVGLATNLALTGISQVLAPGPETDQGTAESYLFNGPTNNITQGLPVPVAYGELIVGGAPISFSYTDNGASYATIDPGSYFEDDESGDSPWR